MTGKPRISVDIWSDIMCPWCAIGYTQFARAIDLLDGEMEVETRWMPFELAPDMPQEGKSQAQHLADVYKRTPDEVARMRGQIEQVAERVGFPMVFDGPEGEPGMTWNTFEAHKLLRWALAEQGPAAQTRLKLALLRAHFQQRRPVGQRETLLAIAGEEGFDTAGAAQALDDEALAIAVRLEEKRGLEAGINSVPSFVINGRYLVQGAREPEEYANMLRKAAVMAAGGEVRNA
ncbi:putative DsbA family dithiol-disulfide isomerase [Altererythrobacter atlanticus]|uniref:DSBA-like thioredoxin domain protein n=1 Tax=Croceibacterium atlanticum TaxID=1267766 RepID=A0A0F7KU18_9SPHN|nr:DsbA family oxidoreductase [Croceibacterium atlanticum]AKH42280.1 DSBA-like thioredoxin domain protein [Croceibacterium atlanticum]MBB5731057.1 putative DsbA family dithiol-disulfide isomerase [Croceibacterium atlanticum]